MVVVFCVSEFKFYFFVLIEYWIFIKYKSLLTIKINIFYLMK